MGGLFRPCVVYGRNIPPIFLQAFCGGRASQCHPMEGDVSADRVRQYGATLAAVFRRNLRYYRRQRRMKQWEVAMLAHYRDHSAISKIERGEMAATPVRQHALALALGVPLALLFWEPFPPPFPPPFLPGPAGLPEH